jgi:flavodoxin I
MGTKSQTKSNEESLMATIGLFYGSNTGNTETIAYRLAEKLNEIQADVVEVFNIGAVSPNDILKWDNIIIGIPTWNTGELQDDWAIFLPKMEGMNFAGKKVALFGLGDQNGYGFNFLDAAGVIADEVAIQDGTVVGYWSNEDYEFEASLAEEGPLFMCLGIDEDGQPDKTDERLTQWANQVLREFGILEPA